MSEGCREMTRDELMIAWINCIAEIKYLRTQMEKMKNCLNCKYGYWDYGELMCSLELYGCNLDKWEIKEVGKDD